MRISVIIHGPEAVDSGLALQVLDKASAMGDVRAMVGGTTAVAAVIDAGLEDRIDISRRELPSAALRNEAARSDLIIMVNRGKDRESSIAFGRLVMSKAFPVPCPVLQIDEGTCVLWSGQDEDLTMARHFCEGEVLDLRGGFPIGTSPTRVLSGVRPGENVWVNGHVIGRAEEGEVRISASPEGRLLAEGVRLKRAGVERLGSFDPWSAIIRSGQIRRTRAVPRSLRSSGQAVYLIDHCAEGTLFNCRDAAYAITVGDDTSKITSSLLYRLGVPVIAITDGDEDGIADEDILYPGSYIFRLVPGNDDQVGAEIGRKFFQNAPRAELFMGIDDMASQVRAVCGDRLLWEKRF